VTLDSGTVAVLPSPAEAPPPPTCGRKKAEPTVAIRPEVPEWARKAAARNTPAEMAAVPEAALVLEPASDAPAPKKGRAPKAAKAKTPAKTAKAEPATPGSLRAIGNGWLDHMRAKGSSASTLSSYRNDLEVAHEFFGEVRAADLSADQVARFNASKMF
jgi:hypothetical protein